MSWGKVEQEGGPIGSIYRRFDTRRPGGQHLRVRCFLDERPFPVIDVPPPTIFKEIKIGFDVWQETKTLAEMNDCYQALFRQIMNGTSDEEVARNAYGSLNMLDSELIFSGFGSFSYSWGMVNALAQKEALASVAAEANIKEENMTAFCSDLIFREQNLFCKTCVPSMLYDEKAGERRWWFLYYWHRSWLGTEYLGYPKDILIEGGIAISKQAIEKNYRNPFPQSLWVGLEGVDRCGKDTQADLLRYYLEYLTGNEVFSPNFPTGSLFGRLIRDAIEGRFVFDNFTLQKLFVVDRAHFRGEHADGFPEIMVTDGFPEIMITRRHSASGLAYGPGGRAELLQRIVDNMELGWADLTIVVDTDVKECLRRIRPGERGLFETGEQLSQARSNYLALVDMLPNIVVVEGMKAVDGGRRVPRTPEEIFRDVVFAISKQVSPEKLSPDLRELMLSELDAWVAKNQKLFVI